MATNNTLTMFASFQSFIETEQETKENIRNVIRDLEQKQREMMAVIQGVHHKASKDNIHTLCSNVRAKFPPVITDLQRLIAQIPAGQYYRYHDHWRLVIQQFVFLVAFITYLEKEELVSREEAAAALDLNDGLTDAQFVAQYGALDDPRYEAKVREIDAMLRRGGID